MEFVTNLRPQTIETFAEQAYQPHAWLLSSHRLSNSTLRHALMLRERGDKLFADNGTKKLIDETLQEFGPEAKAIQAELRQVRRTLNCVPRGQSVPADLRQRGDGLGARRASAGTAPPDAGGRGQLAKPAYPRFANLV